VLIVEQGEGSSQDREDTRYRAFTAIRDELAEMTSLDPTFEPAWPAGDSPVLRSPPEPDNMLFVENPEAASLLDFSCAASPPPAAAAAMLWRSAAGRRGPAIFLFCGSAGPDACDGRLCLGARQTPCNG
jgi:hypothetical protein